MSDYEKFTVEIRTINAAFEGDALPYEVATLLRDLAYRIEYSGPAETYSLYDANGHRVGAARFHKEQNVNRARKDH